MYSSYNSDMMSSGGDTDTDSDSNNNNNNNCGEIIDMNDLENIRVKNNIPIIMNQDKLDTIGEIFFISVDSKDRFFQSGNTTFDYNINSLGKVYKNVADFSIEGIVIPNLYLDPLKVHGLHTNSIISTSNAANSNVIRTRRISDLNYITLKISNLSGNTDGSNNNIRKSSGVLVLDRSLDTSNSTGTYVKNDGDTNFIEIGNKSNSTLAGMDTNNLVFKPMESLKFEFQVPIASLFDLKFTICDPYGNTLSLLNDYLTIDYITLDNNKLVIRTNEYFSPDEYKVGDHISVSNLVINTPILEVDNNGLVQFLQSTIKTHPILALGEKTTDNVNPDPLNSSNLFNVIYTGIDYTLNKSTGVISTNDFSIGANVVRLTSGNLINNNLQNSIFMNINSKRNTSDFLKTRMI